MGAPLPHVAEEDLQLAGAGDVVPRRLGVTVLNDFFCHALEDAHWPWPKTEVTVRFVKHLGLPVAAQGHSAESVIATVAEAGYDVAAAMERIRRGVAELSRGVFVGHYIGVGLVPDDGEEAGALDMLDPYNGRFDNISTECVAAKYELTRALCAVLLLARASFSISFKNKASVLYHLRVAMMSFVLQHASFACGRSLGAVAAADKKASAGFALGGMTTKLPAEAATFFQQRRWLEDALPRIVWAPKYVPAAAAPPRSKRGDDDDVGSDESGIELAGALSSDDDEGAGGGGGGGGEDDARRKGQSAKEAAQARLAFYRSAAAAPQPAEEEGGGGGITYGQAIALVSRALVESGVLDDVWAELTSDKPMAVPKTKR